MTVRYVDPYPMKIGAWVEAWLFSPSRAHCMAESEPTRVLRVIAAPWQRSRRTDWLWREIGRTYAEREYGGELAPDAWGRRLFPDEVSAWEAALAWEREVVAQLEAQLDKARAEMQDVAGMLALKRLSASQEATGA